jgi:hypothetical protein
LVQQSECGCSEAEILRMERCILTKFEWSPRASPTSIEFIHLFHALVLNKCPLLVSSPTELDVIRRTLKDALLICSHRSDLLEYPPSTVALSVLSLYLEFTWSHWQPATQRLQALVRLSDADLTECRQLVTRCLGSHLIHFSRISKTTSPKILPQLHDCQAFLSPNYRSSSLSPTSDFNVRSGSSASLEVLHGAEPGKELITGSVIRKEMTPPPSLPVTPNPPSKRRRVEQDDDVYSDIRKLYMTFDDTITPSQSDIIDMSCGMEMSSGHNNECLTGIVMMHVAAV